MSHDPGTTETVHPKLRKKNTLSVFRRTKTQPCTHSVSENESSPVRGEGAEIAIMQFADAKIEIMVSGGAAWMKVTLLLMKLSHASNVPFLINLYIRSILTLAKSLPNTRINIKPLKEINFYGSTSAPPPYILLLYVILPSRSEPYGSMVPLIHNDDDSREPNQWGWFQ